MKYSIYIKYNFKQYFLFVIILIVQVVVILYYGNFKLNLFGDEAWTFNLANSYFEPFLGDASKYYDKWLDSNFWNQAVTVSPEHRFSLKSVFYNQSQDVHPPFYYVIIHIICSFFPGKFNKWFGIVPNILFFVVSQFVIFTTIKRLFSKKCIALSISIFYGFSWGTINNVLYIRMYALLSLFAVISYAFHLILLNKMTSKCYICILITSFFGILTQYYFIIYEFFLSFGFCIILLTRKKYKELFFYILGFILLAVVVILFYPPIIDQLFGKIGNQGQAAFNNLLSSNFLQRIFAFIHVLSNDLFGSHILWVIAIILFLLICSIYITYHINITNKVNKHQDGILFCKIQRNHKCKIYYIDLCMIYSLFCCVGYFFVVSKIAPFFVSRYIVIIYPQIVILFFYLLNKLFYICNIRALYFYIVFFIILFLSCIKMYDKNNLFIYDKNYANIENVILKENNDIGFIIVTKFKLWWPTMNEVLTLRRVDKSYMITENEINSLDTILEKYFKSHNSLMLYLASDCNINDNEFLNILKSKYNAASVEKLDYYCGDIYLFKFQNKE